MPAPLPEAIEGPGQREAAQGHHYLILAVDDNPNAIVFIKKALQDTLYTII